MKRRSACAIATQYSPAPRATANSPNSAINAGRFIGSAHRSDRRFKLGDFTAPPPVAHFLDHLLGVLKTLSGFHTITSCDVEARVAQVCVGLVEAHAAARDNGERLVEIALGSGEVTEVDEELRAGEKTERNVVLLAGFPQTGDRFVQLASRSLEVVRSGSYGDTQIRSPEREIIDTHFPEPLPLSRPGQCLRCPVEDIFELPLSQEKIAVLETRRRIEQRVHWLPLLLQLQCLGGLEEGARGGQASRLVQGVRERHVRRDVRPPVFAALSQIDSPLCRSHGVLWSAPCKVQLAQVALEKGGGTPVLFSPALLKRKFHGLAGVSEPPESTKRKASLTENK